MTSITQYERFDTSDGIELIIDTQTGESFASIRGYARMAERAESTIRSRLKAARTKDAKTAKVQTPGGLQGARTKDAKTAKVQTPGGLQGVDLIDEITISQWIIKDNPDLAFKRS